MKRTLKHVETPDTGIPKKRGRYKLYEYRDSGCDVPRRTEYALNHHEKKRPQPKCSQQRSTPHKHELASCKPSKLPELVPQAPPPQGSPTLNRSLSPAQNGSAEVPLESHSSSPVSPLDTSVPAYPDVSTPDDVCDGWEFVEDNELSTRNEFADNLEEDFPEYNTETPDSPIVQPNNEQTHSDDSEPEDEECLSEASDLHLNISERIKLLLLLATKKRHKLTYSAAESIMKLTGVVSQTECFTPSKHLMKRAIKLYSAALSEHHLCPKCSFYHGLAEEEFTCLKCGRNVVVSENKKAGYCFLYLSIREQLKFLLECGLLDKVISPQQREKIQTGNYEDIYDGKMYRDRVPSDQDWISFNFFVDGVQVASTSKNAGWPVLLCINELPLNLRRKHIIMACVWVSKKKPDMNEYLKPFVDECNELAREGISVNCDGSVKTVRVRPLMCVSDSIARPLLRNSTQFNGEFGCGLCYHPGKSMKRGRGYARSYSISDREYPLRTHEETMNLARTATADDPQKGIKGVSILSEIEGFDIIQCLDLDLFHALVNTAKRFTNLWLHKRYSGKKFSLSNKIAALDKRLLGLKVTSDVSRAPRSLLERSDYRGHEWFNWIIFYSIPVLKGILPSRFLNHWALLVHAVVLLMQNSVAKSDVYYAARFLRQFNQSIDKLYGAQHVTFSCHLLTHLELSVKNFGQPWSHSAFMFENFLGELKAVINSGNGVAYQISTHMQLKLALAKMREDLWFAMNDRDKQYLESVTVFQRFAAPHLVLGPLAFLGEPHFCKLSVASYRAVTRSGVNCDQSKEYPVYLRCLIDDEIFQSRNYARALKTENSVVLLDSDEVFHIDLFVVIDNVGFALGHFLLDDTQKVCDVKLPHIRVFKENNEGLLRCVPISQFQSKLISFTIQLSDSVLRLGCVNVLKMEMLI